MAMGKDEQAELLRKQAIEGTAIGIQNAHGDQHLVDVGFDLEEFFLPGAHALVLIGGSTALLRQPFLEDRCNVRT